MESLHKNQTWKLVELLEEKRAIRCKKVYKNKKAISEKEDEKFKARLIAKGYSYKKKVDYYMRYFPYSQIYFHRGSVELGSTFWYAVRIDRCQDIFSLWWFEGVDSHGTTRRV